MKGAAFLGISLPLFYVLYANFLFLFILVIYFSLLNLRRSGQYFNFSRFQQPCTLVCVLHAEQL